MKWALPALATLLLTLFWWTPGREVAPLETLRIVEREASLEPEDAVAQAPVPAAVEAFEAADVEQLPVDEPLPDSLADPGEPSRDADRERAAWTLPHEAGDLDAAGRRYRQVTVVRIEPDGIHLRHAGGIAKIDYDELPGDWRERYRLTAGAAERYRAEVLRAQHQWRLQLAERGRWAAALAAEEEQAVRERAVTRRLSSAPSWDGQPLGYGTRVYRGSPRTVVVYRNRAAVPFPYPWERPDRHRRPGRCPAAPPPPAPPPEPPAEQWGSFRPGAANQPSPRIGTRPARPFQALEPEE